MEKLKKIIGIILFPGKMYGIIIGVIFIAASIVVFLWKLNNSPIAYVSYVLAAYGLYLLIVSAAIPFARIIAVWLRKNPYIDRYYADIQFKTRVVLYRSASLNIGYAIFKLAVGVWYHSMWFIAIAIYYIILSAIRFVLIQTDSHIRKRRESRAVPLNEWKAYRACACLIMLMNLSLFGIVFQVIRDSKSYSYPGAIIFAMAFYAFYRIVIAAIRLLKGRKNRRPIFTAAKIIDFLFAVIAIFTLQTAMLSTFDEVGSKFSYITNIIGGSSVFVIVLAIATYMIVHSNKQIKNIRTGE